MKQKKHKTNHLLNDHLTVRAATLLFSSCLLAFVLLAILIATSFYFNDFNLQIIMILTRIVNLPVSNSVRNGSDIGSMLSRSSSRRINTCCSNNATARGTSNLRANTNFSAVDVEIVLPSSFLFTISINSLTAWRSNEKRAEKTEKYVLSVMVFLRH